MAAKKKLAAANAILHNNVVSQNEKVGQSWTLRAVRVFCHGLSIATTFRSLRGQKGCGNLPGWQCHGFAQDPCLVGFYRFVFFGTLVCCLVFLATISNTPAEFLLQAFCQLRSILASWVCIMRRSSSELEGSVSHLLGQHAKGGGGGLACPAQARKPKGRCSLSEDSAFALLFLVDFAT